MAGATRRYVTHLTAAAELASGAAPEEAEAGQAWHASGEPARSAGERADGIDLGTSDVARVCVRARVRVRLRAFVRMCVCWPCVCQRAYAFVRACVHAQASGLAGVFAYASCV
jgi:hypothetical protein